MLKVFSITASALKTINDKIKKELEDLKKTVRNLAIIGFLLFIGFFFLIVGASFYIETIYNWIPGMGFLVVGGGAIIISILYYLITK